jgi:hypothetical protein
MGAGPIGTWAIRLCVFTAPLIGACSGEHPQRDETAPASSTALHESPEARATIGELRARHGRLRPAGHTIARRDGALELLLPHDPGATAPPLKVRLAAEGAPSWVLTDTQTAMSVAVTLEGANSARAEIADGIVAYRDAAPGGGSLLVRPQSAGVEDFVEIRERSVSRVSYRIELTNVAGLRLVDGTLELLDATGDPRLRVRAPEVIDAARHPHATRLELDGCRADLNPADPWSRPVTAPGARSCRVDVSWDARSAVYPVLVDPAWVKTTNNMASVRAGHAAARYGTGTTERVLVSGGRSSPTVFLASAELYNPATNSWATTGSMPQAKAFHTLTAFGTSGSPHAVGGQISSTPAYTNTVYRYNASTGTWSTMAAMPAARAYHAALATSTIAPVQTLYVTGGTNDTTAPYSPSNTHYRFHADLNAWNTLAAMPAARMRHAIFNGGSVLTRVPQVVGGASSCASWTSCTALASSDRYSIETNTWSTGGAMPSALSDATFAENIVVGSGTGAIKWMGGSSWAAVNPLPQALSRPAAATVGSVGSGRVIAAGGALDGFKFTGTNWLNANGASDSFTPGASPTFAESTATRLESGAVLFAGGAREDGSFAALAYRFIEMAQGAACTQQGECATDVCADGYCCNTACTGLCVACSAAKKGQGSNGLCGAVIDGTDPDDDCALQPASTCGQDGQCDGASACRLHAADTECQQPSCLNAQLTTWACNGGGSCLSSTSSCNGYSCASSAACNTTCTTSSQCAPSHYCAVNVCQPKLSNGTACTSAAQCSSTFCVDGVCCDGACLGLCTACSAAKKGAGGGASGICGPIADGTDPDAECPNDGVASCQRDGQCDGAGACRLYASGVSCGATVCTGSNSVTGQICIGGACSPGGVTVPCDPYLCSGGACTNPCVSDAGCVQVPPHYCDAGTCKPKLANGQTCSAANQCQSAQCVDGFCCNAACGGLCQACSAAKKGSGQNGECGSIAGGLDPDNECSVIGECGQDGTCDGGGSCKLRASGSPCGSPVCVGNNLTPQACNGSGTCVTGTGGTSCAPYVCQSTACATPCASDAHCVSGNFCDAGACVGKLANGTPCTAPNQCSSNACVDGVCCNSACTSLCQACSAAKKGGGSDGDCGPVLSGLDPDNECAVGATECGQDGTCDGQGTCKLTVSGTPCGSLQCVQNKVTPQSCNGTGSCVNEAVGTDCTPHLCVAGACANPCTSDSQCVNNTYYCSAGACVAKKAKGSACTAASECASNFCVDGVCCGTACASTCQACTAALKVSGVDGDCGPVKSGLDPHNDCPDDGAISCQRDGMCDGAVGCRLYSQGVSCGVTQCVGNSVKGQICNGIGSCGTEIAGVECAPYLCLAGGCSTSCQSDAECFGSQHYCNGGLCDPKQQTGASCTLPSQCASGFCVDGYCCDALCNGQCEACDVTGSPGQCTTVPDGQPHGARQPCAGTGDCQGQCDGTDPTKCSLPDSATQCSDAACTGDVSQPAGSCDGAGQCGTPTTVSCLPYTCDGASGQCKATCVSDVDCSQGAKCDTVSGKCAVTGATCKDPYTTKQPNGQEQSCKPYKCVAGSCADSCTTSSDCAPGYECAAPTCVPVTDAGGSGGSGGSGGTDGGAGSAGSSSGDAGDEGGCGCRLTGERGSPDGRRAGLGVLLAAMVLLRRRRPARRPGDP